MSWAAILVGGDQVCDVQSRRKLRCLGGMLRQFDFVAVAPRDAGEDDMGQGGSASVVDEDRGADAIVRPVMRRRAVALEERELGRRQKRAGNHCRSTLIG